MRIAPPLIDSFLSMGRSRIIRDFPVVVRIDSVYLRGSKTASRPKHGIGLPSIFGKEVLPLYLILSNKKDEEEYIAPLRMDAFVLRMWDGKRSKGRY